MLYKNFGMTRQGRVVFYDYDEVVYLTDVNFRTVPPPRTPEDEMASEPWYPVGAHDVFPEEFGTFLLGNAKVRGPFLRYHADLLSPDYWRVRQDRIRAGRFDDVFPYPESLRFGRSGAAGGLLPMPPTSPRSAGAATTGAERSSPTAPSATPPTPPASPESAPAGALL